MARRRNAIAHRFARMRGLPPEEKALMQRIGHLIDSALNNRQAANPFEQSQSRENRQIFPPTGLLTKTGLSSVKIIWDATPSNELLRYEVDFINLTLGTTDTETTFTNEIIYRGRTGNYVAHIKSVGRDGSSSPVNTVEFGIGADVMLIEGAKNNATELGTLVQDNIELLEGYSVYAWGSCVLDKYVIDENDSIVFRLWRAETANAVLGQATLVETITLYPATESGADLDTTARAGVITRPSTVRPGSFETSQAVMFSPQQVDPADVGKTVTYFLQAVNREVEDDEVCLSLVLWAGSDGVATSIPGDQFIPEPPYVFPHFNSFHGNGNPQGIYQGIFPYDTRSWNANIEDGYSMIGNKWTIGMWVRFDTLDANKMFFAATEAAPDQGKHYLLSRQTIPIGDGNNIEPNSITISVGATLAAGGGLDHTLRVEVWDKLAGLAGGIPGAGGTDSRVTQYQGLSYGGRTQFSAIFPWGDSQEAPNATQNNAWYFIVVCFEGGHYVNNNLPKIRTYINNGADAITNEPFMQLLTPSSDQSVNEVTQDDTGSLAYHNELSLASTSGKYWSDVTNNYSGVFAGDLNTNVVNPGIQYYQLGIWNVALDSDEQGMGWNSGPIETLHNLGRGWAVDWRKETDIYDDTDLLVAHLDYRVPENLVHFNQFGAVEQAFSTKKAGRDMGLHLSSWRGELNWTFDRSEQDYEWVQPYHNAGVDHYHQMNIFLLGTWYDNLPQSWNRGTDIYDVLSPGGTNNTTEYLYSYPGQQMSGNGAIGTQHTQPDLASSTVPASRVSAPYPPGYAPDDPNRPITGGA